MRSFQAESTYSPTPGQEVLTGTRFDKDHVRIRIRNRIDGHDVTTEAVLGKTDILDMMKWMIRRLREE